ATLANQDRHPLKFTGHERDFFAGGESDDLDYMHARYCDPFGGRFLSTDPVGGEPNLPQSWNRYAYVQNNPINAVDPDGEVALPLVFAAAVVGGALLSPDPANAPAPGDPLIEGGASELRGGAYAAGFFSLVRSLLAIGLDFGGSTPSEPPPARARHFTSKDGARGIKEDMAIDPSRGDPLGVDVEVEPFGPPSTAKGELGADKGDRFVEFDLPEGSVPHPNIGPRNTRRIPTDTPLDISGLNPVFRRASWFGL
ncbi:MAG: hypothetical protein GY725_04340, partial [bacterium]|nr:hypothetical protein [bacterium]